MTRRRSATSYAILGLLAIKPWSTYELTKQMGRAIHLVWPRAESNLYQEPQRLVDDGLATADRRLVGRRPRTEYAITPAGREALEAWLSEPSAATQLESETLIKVLFGNYVPPATLVRQLEAFAAEAETTEAPWRAIAHEYIDDRGPFPERVHVNALFWVLLDRWARMRSEWAHWAASQVATWPDSSGPTDRAASRAMLATALRDGSRLPDGPAASGQAAVAPAPPAIDDLVRDALTADLTVIGPKAGATSGEPVESALEVFDDGRTSIGIWSCTPGTWPSAKDGLGELMHFVAGHGWITDADGTRHEIKSGFVRFFPDGWRGSWDVDETVRKVYVLVATAAG